LSSLASVGNITAFGWPLEPVANACRAGAKLEDFAVHKSVASRKVSPKKSKKRRRAKR
jgi:hypothetical protein